MKRIAIVAHGLDGGGAERVASILANHFASDGYKVCFIAAYSSKKIYKLEPSIEYNFIETSCKNKIVKFMDRSRKIYSTIKRFGAEKVISFIYDETVLCSLSRKIPIIYTLRNNPANVTKDKKLCILLYKRAEKIVFQTPQARDFFPENISKKGFVIGNPLSDGLPYWYNEPVHEKVIMTACRLTEQKNLKMLIEGFSNFHEKHNDYILRIFGEGPLLEELKTYCARIGIEKFVEFPGYSSNVHREMVRALLFALTSDFEGVSNSMLEALAIGVPTICTDCPPGGAAMYIKSGENGILIPVGNVEALTDALTKLADNPDLCKKISMESVKIRSQLEAGNIYNQWKDVVEGKKA